MKEEKKKVVKKTTAKKEPKKTATKKPAVKKTLKKEEKVNLNETVQNNEVKEKVVINANNDLKECVFCHEKFEKGYTICPHCHRRQKTSVSFAFFIVFALLFLFVILSYHFVSRYFFNNIKEDDYKKICVLVDYEQLVRHPKEYKGKDVRVIGQVVEVTGFDTGYGNQMTITLNANLFEDSAEHLITVNYIDKSYDQGFIEGDLVTVYGSYESINGNVPYINAEYIVFGK